MIPTTLTKGGGGRMRERLTFLERDINKRKEN